MPVSTTHAIVGSLLGVALMAFGTAGVAWNILIWKVALPLLLSPLVALAATILLRRMWEQWQATRQTADDCICVAVGGQAPLLQVGGQAPLLQVGGQAPLLQNSSLATATFDGGLSVTTCDTEVAMPAVATALITVDKLHWLSAGLTSFARGMNDAPKLAGLMLGAAMLSGGGVLPTQTAFIVVAVAMTVGGLIAGLRVTKVLAEKVTKMNHHEGFTANIVTSVLVSAGAVFGLPMSTTHVSTSALIGVGASGAKGDLQMGTVKKLLAAWVITLPGAAALGIMLFWLAKFAQ